MAVLEEGGRRTCGVGSGKFYRKPQRGSHPCWLRGITTGTEGAEKGSLEPEHGVSAGSDGKTERPGRTRNGGQKTGEECWCQIPQDSNETRDSQCFHQ